MKSMPFTRSQLAMAVATVALAACGGGGGGGGAAPTDPVAGSEIPNSATTSSDGAYTFVNGLAVAPNDTAEPLVAGDAVLATSDTDEPTS